MSKQDLNNKNSPNKLDFNNKNCLRNTFIVYSINLSNDTALQRLQTKIL